MIAVVATVDGTFAVDLESGEVTPSEDEVQPVELSLNLPRLVAADAAGPTVVAVVHAKPPLLISYDTGATWRESGRGLPPGRAVAVAETDPDTIVFASRN